LQPGESFTYTSAAMIETPFGYMQGSYYLIADDGIEFDTEIPAFRLSIPHTLH
jgi:ApaG protein